MLLIGTCNTLQAQVVVETDPVETDYDEEDEDDDLEDDDDDGTLMVAAPMILNEILNTKKNRTCDTDPVL